MESRIDWSSVDCAKDLLFAWRPLASSRSKSFVETSFSKSCVLTLLNSIKEKPSYKFRICHEEEDTFVHIGAAILLTLNALSVLSIVWLHHLSKYLNLHKVSTYFPCKPILHRSLVTDLIEEGKAAKLEEVLKTPGAGTRQDAEGFLPINFAISKGQSGCLEVLLRAKFDATEVDGTGKTPATTACEFGQSKCLEVLIRAGIDVTAEDGTGKTPA